MTRRLILPAVLLLTLAGCSSSTSDDQSATGAPEQGAEQVTCEGFYEGTGTPLADRADSARTALAAGEVEDGASYTEINALEQRIRELGEDATSELAGLLEEVNAPFTEAVAAVNEARAQEAPEGEESSFPDLSQLDLSGSEDAQSEFDSACSDAGYGA